MKKKIVLNRFYHRGRGRIGFVFEWDDSLVAIIRTINGSSYSSTNSCWYADDNEETLKQILQAFRDKVDIDISLLVGRQESDNSFIPEAEQGISFPPGSGSSDLTIPEKEDIEEEMIPGRTEIRNVVERQRSGPVEFRMNENDGYLVVRFTGFYDKEWIDELKAFGRLHYDKIRKEFSLP
jgi:hypothetical protein